MEEKVDYCSMWPDKHGDIDFSHCCKQHDDDYAEICKLSFFKRIWARHKADMKLKKCVADAGLPVMGVTMLLGVRMFGWIFILKEKLKEKFT